MGILGLSVLLLAVEVWLVMDCVSSLDVESVSVCVIWARAGGLL